MFALDHLSAGELIAVYDLQDQQGWQDETLKDLILQHAINVKDQTLVEYLENVAYFENSYSKEF